MMEISDVVEAPVVLFLDVPNGATTAVERMGVVFRCYQRVTGVSRPNSVMVIGFWDETYEIYRLEKVKLMHIIRPIYEEEIFLHENTDDENP